MTHPSQAWKESLPKTSSRTVGDFVEDLLSEGKSLRYIMTLTGVTRWESQRDEIRGMVKEFLRKRRKIQKKSPQMKS